jgi:iron complex outermembrane recepter protein
MYNQRQEQFQTDPLTTLDVGVGISGNDGQWGIDVVARNLTNSISEDFASPAVDPLTPSLAGPNQLRTVMVIGRIKF